MSNLTPEPQMPRVPEASAPPKPPEAKPVEKPLGPPEQAALQEIKQAGNDPDKALRAIAGDQSQATTLDIRTTINSGESAMDETTAMQILGSSRPATNAEKISAATQHPKIADRWGWTQADLAELRQNMPAPTTGETSAPETTNTEPQKPLGPEQTQAFLDEISLQAGLGSDHTRKLNVLPGTVEEAIAKGVPRAQIEAILETAGIPHRQKAAGTETAPVQTEQVTPLDAPKVKAEVATNVMPEPPYEEFARNIPIDPNKPPQPGDFWAPSGGNAFGDNDTPTLAGKVICKAYNSLVDRPDYQKTPNVQEVIDRGNQGRQDFVDYITALNKQREAAGLQPIKIGANHESGTDSFNFGGHYGTSTTDHLFYFNKSHDNWRVRDPQEVRGYVTVGQTEAGQIQRQFVDLATQMYDAGIDFTAKAGSFLGTSSRTDNMVFYISSYDQPRAAAMMKQFLTERGIGQGHVMAATPSPQEGLSWAMEPTADQRQIWQEVSGSSQDASFNAYVATMAMPIYLDRLAQAHAKLGNAAEAQTFRQEVQRVQAVINSHKTN